MFTGIVTGVFPVVAVNAKPGLTSFGVELDARHCEGLQIGASVSLNGVCMTVTKLEGRSAGFDAAAETLAKTTLGRLQLGTPLNVERSARAGAEIGGHPVSGHADGICQVIAIDKPENNCVLTFALPPNYARYVFNKGFIALNGCSLTVCDLDKRTGRFRVYLIPETLRMTTFGQLQVGDGVNFEIDRQTQIIVDTIEAAVETALRGRSLG